MNYQSIEIARRRLELAKYWNKVAREIQADDHSLVSLRCLYLSFLQSMRSALITIDIDPLEDEKVINYFWELFVITGEFDDTACFPLVKELSEIAIAMDYNDKYSPEEYDDSVSYYQKFIETLLDNVYCWIEMKERAISSGLETT